MSNVGSNEVILKCCDNYYRVLYFLPKEDFDPVPFSRFIVEDIKTRQKCFCPLWTKKIKKRGKEVF